MQKLISGFDLFPASPTLRVKGQSNVVNLCGGIFSILVFLTFVYIFISNVISTVKLERITAVEVSQMRTPNLQHIGNISIGIGLQYMNLSSMRNIFELQAYIGDKQLNYIPIPIFPCTREYWKSFSDAKYKSLNLESFLCLQRQNVQIFGQNGAEEFNAFYISLSRCNNLTSSVLCASNEYIDHFFNTSMIGGRFLASSFVLLDTGINPTSQNPIIYNSNQKTMWLLFSPSQSVVVQTFLGTYQIVTDKSFLPYSQEEKLKGYFVSEAAVTNLFKKNQQPIFLQIYIFSSSVKRTIQRTYGKIDDILSYVGGLYGFVISFFALFLASFNEYRYQLKLGQGAFSFRDKKYTNPEQFTFLRYLKFTIFDYLNTFFCLSLKWEDCNAINRLRRQVVEQVDAKYLLKRIVHLQKFMHLKSGKQKLRILSATEDPSLESTKERRLLEQYCQRFADKEMSMTIQQFISRYEVEIKANANANINNSSISSNNELLLNQNLESLGERAQSPFSKIMQKNEEKKSLQIMDEYLIKFKAKFPNLITESQLSENDIKSQKNLAQSFYSLSQSERIMTIKKIPLGILDRMKIFKESIKQVKQQAKKRPSILPPLQKKYGKVQNSLFEYVQN